MSARGAGIRTRVWCFTPNPVLETRFESKSGRRTVSAGGKAHNVARQLRRWGISVISLVPHCGEDWLFAAKRDKAPIIPLPVRAPARKGWAVVDETGRRLDYFSPDMAWKESEWNATAAFLQKRITEGDWLVVAGSVPRGASSGWWRILFQELKKRGVRMLVDSRGPVMREALEAGVDWAKGNLHEAEETMGGRGGKNCLQRMRKRARNRSSCVITLGSSGLLVQANVGRLRVRSPNIRLRDATGSGDVVTAALVYGCLKGWSMQKTAEWAARMGAANAARPDVCKLSLRG